MGVTEKDERTMNVSTNGRDDKCATVWESNDHDLIDEQQRCSVGRVLVAQDDSRMELLWLLVAGSRRVGDYCCS